jgi:glycosyltransferase involved in cell wall biosynthesis
MSPGVSPQLSSLSVLFPAYNDAGTIADLIRAGADVARALTPDFELIVVNDGSRDATGTVLAQLLREQPALSVITHRANRGYGAALRSGFAAARKDWIFYTDGDGQYNPREMVHLAALAATEVDIVNGWKRARGDGWARAGIGRAYQALLQLVFDLPVRDTDCDFRLFRRSLLDRVRLEHDSGAICLELVVKFNRAGARFAEAPVSHFPRRYGRSQFMTFRRVAATLRDDARLWWQLSVQGETP